MQTISIRLDDEVITKIEELRGSEHKSDFYRKLIEHALITFAHKDLQGDDKTITSPEILKELEMKNEIIRVLEGRVQDLQNQTGFLIQDHTRISGQLDRLLMPSPEEIIKKAWWQFWKRSKE